MFEKKHPLLLEGKHELSNLIAENEHLRLMDASAQLLLAILDNARKKSSKISGTQMCEMF